MTAGFSVRDEHAAILALRDGRSPAAVLADFEVALAPAARRARWIACRIVGGDPAAFERAHRAAWRDYLWSAAFPVAVDLPLPRSNGAVLLGMHFPSWPDSLAALAGAGVHCLAPRPLPWLHASLAERIIAFADDPAAAARRVRVLLDAGRPIVAMVDHHYPGFRCSPATLFGRPARLPLGIVALARRRRMPVHLIAEGDGGPVLRECGGDPAGIAAAVERAVTQSPARWLQWVSADAFIDVFAGTAQQLR